VIPRVQPFRARLDEAAHERPILVERRPPVGAVLLEREREVDAGVEVAVERGERAEAEPAQRVVEKGRTHRNSLLTPSAPLLLFGTPGTSRPSAPRRPADRSGSPRRNAGTRA